VHVKRADTKIVPANVHRNRKPRANAGDDATVKIREPVEMVAGGVATGNHTEGWE